jgi:hypothetical protein
MSTALRGHWPEYLIEAAGLGLFMLVACAFGLHHDASQRCIFHCRYAELAPAPGATS